MELRYQILWYSGLYESFVGIILLVLLSHSVYDGQAVLRTIFGMSEASSFAGNSWAQASIAFGMHGYADLMNGIEQMKFASKPLNNNIPKVVSAWNVTRFIISFLWALVLIQGLVIKHGTDYAKYPLAAVLLIALLAFDSIVSRSLSIYCQRSHDDLFPNSAGCESVEWSNYTFVQKCCRVVFFYEGVLSGCSGAVYFMFPRLFVWLYGVENVADNISVWALSNFGVLVTAFGLYQLNAEIDTRWGHILWWLVLDIVWMIVYVQGINNVLGYFNPLTFYGGNFWCHSAFHADSSLAIARTIFLFTLRNAKSQEKVNSKVM